MSLLRVILVLLLTVSAYSFSAIISCQSLSHHRLLLQPLQCLQSPLKTTSSSSSSSKAAIDLLFDSHCPLCMMEVEFLMKRDIDSKIKFTDLNSPDYDSSEHGNVNFSEGMRKIRAVLPDNSVVSGVEVFRRVYAAIGLGWMFEITNVPIIGRVADAIYDIWAENRLRLTGRGELADQLRRKAAELKEKMQDEVICDENGCALVFADDDCGDDGCSLDFDEEK